VVTGSGNISSAAQRFGVLAAKALAIRGVEHPARRRCCEPSSAAAMKTATGEYRYAPIGIITYSSASSPRSKISDRDLQQPIGPEEPEPASRRVPSVRGDSSQTNEPSTPKPQCRRQQPGKLRRQESPDGEESGALNQAEPKRGPVATEGAPGQEQILAPIDKRQDRCTIIDS